MPASRAASMGPLKAVLSTTAMARPSALPETAVLMALTISAGMESLEPVHWNELPSSLQASEAPYCVGVKNGLVVTWQTKTHFQFGVLGKLPIVAAVGVSLLEHADSSAVAASDALASPVPASSRRRLTALRSRVSTASSTLGWTFFIGTPHRATRGCPAD